MQRGYDLHDEKTDIFSAASVSARTEELPTAALGAPLPSKVVELRSSQLPPELTLGGKGPPSWSGGEVTEAARPHKSSDVGRFPFDFDDESEEATEALPQPLLQALGAPSDVLPSDEGAAELRALVQRAATRELRHRRPRRRSS